MSAASPKLSGPGREGASSWARLDFTRILPKTDDPYELELREQLGCEDVEQRCEAALRLGATYRTLNPRAARALLRSALEGSRLTRTRALLRLSYISTMADGDLALACEQLAEARAISDGLEEESPEDHDLIALRIDIATAFGLLQQLDHAVSMLLYLDRRVAGLRGIAEDADDRWRARDADDRWRQAAASINLRLGQLLSHSDPDFAEERLKRAITWGSGSIEATAALHRGWLLEHHRPGLAPLTEEQYRHATELGDPVIAPLARMSLGDALWRSGRPDIAREEWQRVADDGDGEIAQDALSRLRGDWQYDSGEAQAPSTASVARETRPLWVHPPTADGRIATGRAADDEGSTRKNVIIVGAGTGGHYLLPGLQHAYRVMAFVDDDPNVPSVQGIKVEGTIDELERVIEKFRSTPDEIDQVIFAIPTASGTTRNRALGAAHRCGVDIVTIPSMFELHLGQPLVPQLRPFDVFETFGDVPWQVDREAASFARGRRIAITGAGESVGKALALRAAHGHARHILLLDEAPRPLMKVARDLRDQRAFPDVDMRIVDCSDAAEVYEAFEEFKPEAVFHCAAIHHVRSPELPIVHAVRANLISAKVVAEVAKACGCVDFLLASTDRAAHRGTAFDWTKALAERAVKDVAQAPSAAPDGLHLVDGAHRGFRTRVLRLPNTWDREGAIVGGFLDQFRDGGPIHADPRARRKFIPGWDAAQALLRLYGSDQPSGLFVYTRGEVLDFNTIAERLIMVHGLTAGRDIQIDRSQRDETKHGVHLVGAEEGEIGEELAGIVGVSQSEELKADLKARLELLLRADQERNVVEARRLRRESLDKDWRPPAQLLSARDARSPQV